MAQSNTTTLDTNSLQIRRASLGDIPSLPPIFNYFIINTTISFRLESIDVTFFDNVLNTTHVHNLPFPVALTLTSAKSSDAESEGTVAVEKVIGYAYAMPWRSNYRAYRHTVEISIYVDPKYQNVGAGSALMDALMGDLRTTRVRDSATPDAVTSTVSEGEADLLEQADGAGRVREVFSVMSLDTEGMDGGYGLARFYSRWGFEQIGHMKRVGYKFGRWIDVLILQASL